ncbi:FAD-dependent oxidoreductase [Arthrobacter sp. NPDC093128]|uniref:NAD(P)/FAD-dependent oxidoreductase n=1 Tax=Arthrobacter sp. NPDC093128 TaxID=3154979 RepID=UPI0034362029
MTRPAGVVIVGAGQAGCETAVTLRAKGFTGPITVIGDEHGVPYQRPPLSKAFLAAGHDDDSIILRPAEFYESRGITLLSGHRATAIDRSRRLLELEGRSPLAYDALVLATGARNRRLSVPGADAEGVHYLRTLTEAQKLQEKLKSAAERQVVIIGGGFIGLEVAAAARKYGADVTVLMSRDRPMARSVSLPVARYFEEEHRRHGVRLVADSAVQSISASSGQADGVFTADGKFYSADIIVVGIGVDPNIELAATAGLETNSGVVVDSTLRTSDTNIFAIGDCAAFPTQSGLRRIESIQTCVDHARAVAAAIVGAGCDYEKVPWFWTDQFESKLQMAGLIEGYDTTVVRGDPLTGSFSVLCFADGQLIAVESVNRPRDHMAARKLLAARVPVSILEAADEEIELKDLLRVGAAV